uniref:Uncharacterized protein n=1 Tax=viral metagenome TaxID=1070528 RepID=A0A6M3IXK5_9ZZZZ
MSDRIQAVATQIAVAYAERAVVDACMAVHLGWPLRDGHLPESVEKHAKHLRWVLEQREKQEKGVT